MLGAPERARQVLVVDDEPEIRTVLVGALEDEGYIVRTAAHGRAALALLRQLAARPDSAGPDDA